MGSQRHAGVQPDWTSQHPETMMCLALKSGEARPNSVKQLLGTRACLLQTALCRPDVVTHPGRR